MRSPSIPPRHSIQAFALVSVLAILALLLILVLAISSVMHVETRSSASGKNLLLARQNALLGLDTAIGQLQEYAGKDQAVTFPATTFYPTKDINLPTAASPRQGKGDLFDNGTYGFRKFATTSSSRSYLTKVETYLTPNEREDWDTALKDYWNTGRNPRWTGIMDASLRVDRATNPNGNPTALPAQPYETLADATKFGEPKRDQLPVWLVSGNEKFVIDQNADTTYPAGYQTPETVLGDPATDPTVVYLVGEGSATLSGDSADGMDGRVKVTKQEIEATAATGNTTITTGHYAYWVGDESTKANFAVRDPYFAASLGSVAYRNRLQSPQRVGWENVEGFDVATFDENDPKLENIATSKEIALLETTNTSDVKEAARENFHSLTAFSKSLLTDTALGGLRKDLTRFLETGSGLNPNDPIADPDRYNATDPRFRAWGGTNAGFPNSNNDIPIWSQLKDWYSNEASGGGSIAANKDTAPVLTYANFHTGFSFDPVTRQIRIHWIPMIVLWNPYDVGLQSASYDIDVGHSPDFFGFYVASPGVSASDVTLTDANADKVPDSPATQGTFRNNVIPNAGSSADFFYALQTVSTAWNNKTNSGAYFDSRNSDAAIGGTNTGTLQRAWNPMRDRTSNKTNDAVTQPHPTRYVAVDQTMKFRITSSFGPGEVRVFTLGSDDNGDTVANWVPTQRLPLMNDYFEADPASAWWPVMTIQNNAPTADNANSHGLNRQLKLSSDMSDLSFAAPYIRLAFAGDTEPISETFETGSVQFDHIGPALGSNSRTAWNDPPNATYPATSWKRIIPTTDNFVATGIFNPISDNRSGVGSAYAAFRIWSQPVTFNSDFEMDQIETRFPGFSRFNITRSVDRHPQVEFFRSRFDDNNTDRLNSWTAYRGAPDASSWQFPGYVKWDEDQTDGGTAGFAIATPVSRNGQEYAPLKELPFRLAKRAGSEVLSLGQLQQANLAPYLWQPSFVIGNSDASPYTDREAIAGIHSRRVGRLNSYGSGRFVPNDVDNTMVDLSYLINENLWDSYFLSTIVGAPNVTNPLPNSRLRFSTDAGNNLSELTKINTSAAYLENMGALNVNSTSVESWKALLTAFRDLSLGDNPVNTVPIARSLDPISGAIRFTFDQQTAADIGSSGSERNYSKILSGFRFLTDDMIQTLAERIVDEIRMRGPFLSLSDFVNRRLVAPEGAGNESSSWGIARTNGSVGSATDNHNDFINASYDPFLGLQGINGALQRALNVSGINGGVNHPSSNENDRAYSLRRRIGGGDDNTTSSWSGTRKNVFEPTIRMHLDSEHWSGVPAGEVGSAMQGLPGFVTQGDLLAMIGPALTPRGDTFLVRSYGDATDSTGNKVLARAYLEAVVQRMPEPVTAAGTSGDDQWRYTDKYGRKFKIVKLRWLNPEEL